MNPPRYTSSSSARKRRLARAIALAFIPAAGYQLLALIAGLRHAAKRRSQPPRDPEFLPGISVLKPVHGLDPNTSQAFDSQARQHYPTFEILFGVHSQADPAVPMIERLRREFPSANIRLILCTTVTPNRKAGVLMELARHARYPIWVVSDSDISVTPEYLSRVAAPLSDPTVGIVTCPYRVNPHTLAAAWEALGIATDFIPSALVAAFTGVRDFGFGSTLAFRAGDLARAGGFAAIADYLADDYQLARRIVQLGKRAVLSTYVVETSLGNASWSGVWQHQLRWARTIRVSKRMGFAGLPITHAGIWILVALAMKAWTPAAVIGTLRIASALVTGGFVLRSLVAAAFCWLAPLWDVYAFAVWAASYRSNQVRWRDFTFSIDREGRILPS